MRPSDRARLRQLALYVFFGVCTTLVNVVAYYALAHPIGLSTGVSTIVSWVLSVLFAFLTNKVWVFGSRSWAGRLLLREAVSFYVCRLLTGLMDLAIMLVTVDLWGWDDLWMKLASNVLVIILNYVASQCLIFQRKTRG